MNELLACCSCGMAMNWDGALHEDDLHSHFSEGIDTILDVSVFTTLGTVLPWSIWLNPTSFVTLSRLMALGFALVFLRRLPVVWLLQRFIPEIRTGREGAFVGWFGPMGVGALYYALKAGTSDPSQGAEPPAEQVPPENVLKQQIFGIVSWVVFTSTLVHGTTVPISLLGSSIHPSLHPKFMVNEEDTDEEGDETSSLLGNGDQGHPISRSTLATILGDGSEARLLDGEAQRRLTGRGSGLEQWGRGRVSVYDQGSHITICDEHGGYRHHETADDSRKCVGEAGSGK